ncbi:MAG: conjugal transfer protein TraL [Desulfobacteraceae bacterium]|nr:conjugal transfer protein TraL [Desulfobacteraceae bacterium]
MENNKQRINFMLQGKGGIGKSFLASMITQYEKDRGNKIHCVDTDPVNSTLASYTAFNATRLSLMKNGNGNGSSINDRNFDKLMEMFFSIRSDFIVDNGASSFVSMTNYLMENEALEMLIEAGKKVVVHTVIAGGDPLISTLKGFKDLALQLSDRIEIIVWINRFFGDVTYNGKAFEDMQVFSDCKNRINGLINIPNLSKSLYGKDIELMTQNKITFDEISIDKGFPMMTCRRLDMFRKALWKEMDKVFSQ